MYPINNEHKCTLMNTNVIKHVNMVIIITFNIWHLTYIKFGSGYLQSGSAHRRRTLAYLQSRDEPIKALGSSHMTK